MKSVRHLPVAEQYPSRTSMVSFFASNRISGMAISGIKMPRMQKHLRGETRHFVRGRETRLASGRFLRLDRLRINYIRPDLREELEPVPRNPVFRSAPLRHCSGSDSGHLCYSRCAAKRVDNFVCIHVVILAH